MTQNTPIPTRREIISGIRAAGLRLGAVMPFHYPRALLRAFDIHPMEVWGPPHIESMDGPQHFPEYTCPIVQKATRFFLETAPAEIDCILIPHTCDSLQGMASVFRDFIRLPQPVFTLYHPRGRRPSDLKFMEMELRSLSDKLAGFTGNELLPDRLHAEIELEERADSLMGHALLNRRDFPVSDREFYTVIRTREYLPAGEFIRLIESLPAGTANIEGPGILLSGIVPEPMELFDHINRFGAHVIMDDLACGSRRVYRSFDDPDPFVRLARMMISMPPDPTVSTPYGERFEYLKRQMAESGARALLVYNVKFCEPELFYIPMLEDEMKQAGYSFMYVENELTTRIPEQILNRINSFVEVLS